MTKQRKKTIKRLLIIALLLIIVNIILISYSINKINKIESSEYGSLITFSDGTRYYIESNQ